MANRKVTAINDDNEALGPSSAAEDMSGFDFTNYAAMNSSAVSTSQVGNAASGFVLDVLFLIFITLES